MQGTHQLHDRHLLNRVGALGVGLVAAVLGGFVWSFVYSAQHADLYIEVQDMGLAGEDLASRLAGGLSMAFHGPDGETLAHGHSIEPAGYILPIHPDTSIGDCYDALSKWFPSWAPKVRSAAIRSESCDFGVVPVLLESHRASWWMWWFPNPHIGGFEPSYIRLIARVNSRKACVHKIVEYPQIPGAVADPLSPPFAIRACPVDRITGMMTSSYPPIPAISRACDD